MAAIDVHTHNYFSYYLVPIHEIVSYTNVERNWESFLFSTPKMFSRVVKKLTSQQRTIVIK